MTDVGNTGETPVERCVLCQGDFRSEKCSKMYKKGIDTLAAVSSMRGDSELTERLKSAPTGLLIHASCRRDYTKKRHLENVDDGASPRSRKLRSSLSSFNWKTNCFLCGTEAAPDLKHPNRDLIIRVRTFEIRARMLKVCELQLHHWCEDVQARLYDCCDLVAVEARYHRSCYDSFLLPTKSGCVKPGSPVDIEMSDSFQLICQWLETEGDADLYTIDELYNKMSELSAGEIYTRKTLKEKLKIHYGDHVFFATMGGSRHDVLCFREMASFIISDQWYEDRKRDQVQETERIMVTAAKLIREEIRARNYSKTQYPNHHDLGNVELCRDFLTPSLTKFLTTLMGRDLKYIGIGHAITQAVRPKSVLAPLMFGLGVEVDFVFGSRWLLDELHALGLCISYDEIQLFKNSLMQDQNLASLSPAPSHPLQFVADNADSNVKTLDGLGTFHGLGMIVVTKRRHKQNITARVKRLARVKLSDMVKGKGIQILEYKGIGPSALSSVKLTPFIELQFPVILAARTYYPDLLWKSAHVEEV